MSITTESCLFILTSRQPSNNLPPHTATELSPTFFLMAHFRGRKGVHFGISLLMLALLVILCFFKALLQVHHKNACSDACHSLIFVNIQNMLVSSAMQITEY